MREFLEWFERASSVQRAEAVWSLAKTYISDDVEDATRSAIEASLTLFLDDPAPETRMALADALGASERAPRHVMLTLAADLPEIAEHVLSLSQVLGDGELVDIAAAADEAIQVAIASRARVSPSVAAALAEVGGRYACLTLLANRGASIARISFRRIAERFGGEPEVRESMLDRADLPPATRQYLAQSVSTALGQVPLVKALLPELRLRTLSREACERATIAIAAESETEELPALMEHLRVTGQLTTALILRAICAGNIAFFEAALSTLARTPLPRVQRLMRARRTFGLRALYGRAGLAPNAFPAFLAALDTLRQIAAEEGAAPDRYRMTARIVEAVLGRYAGISDLEKNELTTMLRRFAADQARDAARAFSRDAEAA